MFAQCPLHRSRPSGRHGGRQGGCQGGGRQAREEEAPRQGRQRQRRRQEDSAHVARGGCAQAWARGGGGAYALRRLRALPPRRAGRASLRRRAQQPRPALPALLRAVGHRRLGHRHHWLQDRVAAGAHLRPRLRGQRVRPQQRGARPNARFALLSRLALRALRTRARERHSRDVRCARRRSRSGLAARLERSRFHAQAGPTRAAALAPGLNSAARAHRATHCAAPRPPDRRRWSQPLRRVATARPQRALAYAGACHASRRAAWTCAATRRVIS